MKNKPLPPLLLIGIGLTLILLQQAKSKNTLHRKIEETSATIQKLTETSSLTSASSAGSNGTSSETTFPFTSSSSVDRVAQASQDLIVFLTPIKDPFGPKILTVLSDVLTIIENLTDQDLLQLSTRLQEDIESQKPNFYTEDWGSIRVLLVILASEQDPKSAINAVPSKEEKHLIFSSFARINPVEAQQWLKESDFPSSAKEEMTRTLLSNLLSTDAEAWLEAQLEFKLREDAKHLTRIPTEQRPILEAAFHSSEYADIREPILQTLLASALSEGIDKARTQAERLDLDPHDLRDFFSEAYDQEGHNQGELLSWMQDAGADQPALVQNQIFNAMRKWSNTDFEAAANWLSSKEPSPTRDTAIEGFTSSITRIDPEAAIEWTTEIQNLEKQQSSRKQILKTWSKNDPTAAEIWIQENSP